MISGFAVLTLAGDAGGKPIRYPSRRVKRCPADGRIVCKEAVDPGFEIGADLGDGRRWHSPVRIGAFPQRWLSIGVQKGPPIGVQKGPPSSSSVTGMTGALFVLVAA